MGNRKRQYEIVEILPIGVKSVPYWCKDYNNGKGCDSSRAYWMEKHGDIKIVTFQGYNFILPEQVATLTKD